MKEYNVNVTNQFLEELDEILYFFPNSNLLKRKMYYEIKNIVSNSTGLEINPISTKIAGAVV